MPLRMTARGDGAARDQRACSGHERPSGRMVVMVSGQKRDSAQAEAGSRIVGTPALVPLRMPAAPGC